MKTILYLGLLLFAPFLSAQDDLVTITSKEGKSLQVYLKKSTGTKVTFAMLKNKRVHTLDLSKLDEESQEKIKKWKEAGGGASVSYEIGYMSGKRNRPEGGWSDDRVLRLKPEVTIANTDKEVRTKAAKVTVLIMGRPVRDRTGYSVLAREDFSLPVMAPAEKRLFKLKGIVTEYDNRGSYRSGSKYLGYAVLIHDGDSQVIASRSSPPSLARGFGVMLLELKSGYRYDKNLEKTSSSIRY